jgi:hypothetical protein
VGDGAHVKTGFTGTMVPCGARPVRAGLHPTPSHLRPEAAHKLVESRSILLDYQFRVEFLD